MTRTNLTPAQIQDYLNRSVGVDRISVDGWKDTFTRRQLEEKIRSAEESEDTGNSGDIAKFQKALDSMTNKQASLESVYGGIQKSDVLRDALDAGVDLRPYYGKDTQASLEFRKDLGLSSTNKTTDLFIPANPVGNKGGFEFDPNFGTSAYRQLALAAGTQLGLTPEQVNQIGSKHFEKEFYSGNVSGMIGFADYSKGLLDTLSQSAGKTPDQISSLYDAGTKIHGLLNDAAKIESQTSGVFKDVGQFLAAGGPITTGILAAALGPSGAGFSQAMSAAGSAFIPGALQGDISGALKAGVKGYLGVELNNLLGNVGDATSKYLGDNWYTDYAKEGLVSGLGSFAKGGNFGEGAISGIAGVGEDKLLGYAKDKIKAIDLPEFDLPEFDLPNFQLPEFKLPNINLPKIGGFDTPKLNLPDFKTPNLQGGSKMSFFSNLLNKDTLNAALNYYGSEEAIARIRNLGSQGQGMFSNIASQAGQGAEFIPYNIVSNSGTSRFNDGTVTNTLSPLQQGIVSNAGDFATRSLQSYNSPQLQQLGQQAFGDAQGLLSSGAGSTNDLASELYGLQQQTRQPGIDRQRLDLENRLRSQGRLGMMTDAYGGSPEQLAFEKALLEQQSADQYNSLINAESIATSRLNRGKGLFDVGTQANLLPEQINAQRAETGGLLQGITQSPDRLLLDQVQSGGQLGNQRAGSNLARNSLMAELLSKGAIYPLLAEDRAGQLELEQLKALSGGLTGDNAFGNMVSSGVSSVGSSLDRLLGGAVEGLFGEFFGGNQQQPQQDSGYFGGITPSGGLGLSYFFD